MPNSLRVQSSQVTTTPGYTVQLTTSTDHLGKGQHTSLKCISWLCRVVIQSWNHPVNGTNPYKAVIGISFSTIDSIFMSINFMGCSKMLISAIGYYDGPFWSFNGPAHSLYGTPWGRLWLLTPGLGLLRSVALLGMWSWHWEAVWESLLKTPMLWEPHIKTQRALCSKYLRKKSRKTMALRSHEKVSLCQRVEKQPI